MDYFTRWPEARAVEKANAEIVATFIYEKIICRHGTPKVIQSNQGTHFVNDVIKRLTERFRIRHSLSSPYHPQSNGLVERFNKSLCEGIAKVGEVSHEWDMYVAPVLFAYRIRKSKLTQHSPYKLVYGREPVLQTDKVDNGFTLIDRLLEITEKVPQLRETARRAIKEHQAILEQKFGSFKETKFQKGDLVWYYDKAKAMRHDTKLEDKWKGPYLIIAVLDKGAYKLALDGKELRSTVNGNLLKRYHGRQSWEPIVMV